MQKNTYRLILLLLCTSGNAALALQSEAVSQKPDIKTPSFDAVSIRIVEKTKSIRTSAGLTTLTASTKQCDYRADRVVCQLPLRGLILEAFQLKKQEIADFPGLDDRLFLIQGLTPSNTDRTLARLMLQEALEVRFGLKFHRETRLIPVYALIEGKHGAKLQPADDPEHRKLLDVATPSGGRGAVITMSPGQFSAVAISLDVLANDLNTMAGMDSPVINMTGLSGEYKIDLHWTPEEDEQSTSMKILDSGFRNAVQEQLGLKLEKHKLPSNLFVIDHVDSVPTEN